MSNNKFENLIHLQGLILYNKIVNKYKNSNFSISFERPKLSTSMWGLYNISTSYNNFFKSKNKCFTIDNTKKILSNGILNINNNGYILRLDNNKIIINLIDTINYDNQIKNEYVHEFDLDKYFLQYILGVLYFIYVSYTCGIEYFVDNNISKELLVINTNTNNVIGEYFEEFKHYKCFNINNDIYTETKLILNSKGEININLVFNIIIEDRWRDYLYPITIDFDAIKIINNITYTFNVLDTLKFIIDDSENKVYRFNSLYAIRELFLELCDLDLKLLKNSLIEPLLLKLK